MLNYALVFRDEEDKHNLIAKFELSDLGTYLQVPRIMHGPLIGIPSIDRNTIYFIEYIDTPVAADWYETTGHIEIKVENDNGDPAATYIREHAEGGHMQLVAADLFDICLQQLKTNDHETKIQKV